MHFMMHIYNNIFNTYLKKKKLYEPLLFVPPQNFWYLWAGVPTPSFSSRKTATVGYLKLAFYCTAVHKWHECGGFSTVPSFAKNYCMIWHNAWQIAVSLWGTTAGTLKSNSNNLSSTFGDLEWEMAWAYEKPACCKSLSGSLLNLPRVYSTGRSPIADENRGAGQCCSLGHD